MPPTLGMQSLNHWAAREVPMHFKVALFNEYKIRAVYVIKIFQ